MRYPSDDELEKILTGDYSEMGFGTVDDLLNDLENSLLEDHEEDYLDDNYDI